VVEPYDAQHREEDDLVELGEVADDRVLRDLVEHDHDDGHPQPIARARAKREPASLRHDALSSAPAFASRMTQLGSASVWATTKARSSGGRCQRLASVSLIT